MSEEKIERRVVRGTNIYTVVADLSGVEAEKEHRPLGLGYGNYVRHVYEISSTGDTKYYVVHDGWAYRGSLTGCFTEGEGFLRREKVNNILNTIKELLREENKENVIKAYLEVKKAVEESFSDIEP
ncbi:MAG: hypothetical protein QXJ59_07125 [Thermofilaceae archaeon]